MYQCRWSLAEIFCCWRSLSAAQAALHGDQAIDFFPLQATPWQWWRYDWDSLALTLDLHKFQVPRRCRYVDTTSFSIFHHIRYFVFLSDIKNSFPAYDWIVILRGGDGHHIQYKMMATRMCPVGIIFYLSGYYRSLSVSFYSMIPIFSDSLLLEKRVSMEKKRVRSWSLIKALLNFSMKLGHIWDTAAAHECHKFLVIIAVNMRQIRKQVHCSKLIISRWIRW